MKTNNVDEVLDNMRMDVQLSMLLRPSEPQDSLPSFIFEAIYTEYDFDNDSETEKRIAWAEAVIINNNTFADNEADSIEEKCDAHSQELYDVYRALYNEEEYLRKPLQKYDLSPICFLSAFTIEKGYEETQKEILNWIIDYISNYSPVVVHLPIPSCLVKEPGYDRIEYKRDEEKIKERRHSFISQGFLPLRDTDYMYHTYEYGE